MKDFSLAEIQKEIEQIKYRNLRVESDKAWEGSWVRIAFIMLLTYVAVVIFLFLTGSQNIWLSALVPPVGFFLSTLSLPFVKKRWLYRHRQP